MYGCRYFECKSGEMIYLTEVRAKVGDRILLFEGVRVIANSEENARDWLDENGFGYCEIIGVLVRLNCEGVYFLN